MPFFQDVDDMTLIERHIRKVAGLENTQSKVLISEYKRAIKEIRPKLTAAIPGSYTQEQLEFILKQLEAAVSATNRRVKKEVSLGTDMATEMGKEDSIKEVNAFEKRFNNIQRMIPIDLILASADRDNFLFNQFQSSMQTYSETFRNKMQQRLTQGLIQKKPLGSVIGEISADFDGDQWRIARIVRSELHNIYNVAKMRTLGDIRKKLIPDLKKTLFHPMDNRTGKDSIEAARKNLIVDVDQPFKYSFKQGGKVIVREFMAPPDRPNDRSIMVPYRESYDK